MAFINIDKEYEMKLLDLYCGVGVGAIGYTNAGYSCYGVDTQDFNNVYPGINFQQKNVLSLDYEYLASSHQWDVIHASPPCQAYSKATPKAHRHKHQKLIAETRLLIAASGVKKYVVENVAGSSSELHPNLIIYGSFFGLEIEKKRLFRVSTLEHLRQPIILGKPLYGKSKSTQDITSISEAKSLYQLPENFKATVKQIRQGIPPIYTQYIAENYL